jgi:hypothetical protein
MPQVNPTCFHISASSIQSLKACPQRFRLNYREGLRPDKDTDSQRMGTNWHSMHEEYANAYAISRALFDKETGTPLSDQERKDFALTAVVEHLNARYEKMPNTKTAIEWALERTILLTSFVGYIWRWSEDPIEVLASEVAFDLPVHMPRTGLPLPITEALRVGKIDHVIKWNGMVGNMERKSTTRSIEADSDYWDKAKKDTQVSMYALAFRDMAERDDSPTYFNKAKHDGVRFGNTLYDVWHKPTIKPKELSQKDTAALIETKTYFGQEFEVETFPLGADEAGNIVVPPRMTVDGEPCDIEMGKKGFSIRETVGMYAARLLSDIYERPDFYYARREIARTDQEIRKFRGEVYNIYQMMKTFSKSGHWFENESQCRATFPCPFIPVCYGPGADAVCDGKTTPQGFKRIFVDLKVNGESLED